MSRGPRSGIITVVLLVVMGVLGILLWAHYTQFFSSLRMARSLDETLARRIAAEDLLELALARADEWVSESDHPLRKTALGGGQLRLDAADALPGYRVPGELSARGASVTFEVLERRPLPPPAGPLEGARVLRVTSELAFGGGRTVRATRIVPARVANVRASPALAHTLAVTRAQEQYWQSRMDEPLDYVESPKRDPKTSTHHAWHRYNSARNRLRVLRARDGMREGPVFFGPKPAYDADQPVLLNASMSAQALAFLRGSSEPGRRPAQDPSGAQPASTEALWRALAIHLYERKAGFFSLRVAGPFSIDVFLVLHKGYTSPPKPWSPPNEVRFYEPDTELLGWGKLAARPDFERLLLPEGLCSTPGGTRAFEAYFQALAQRRERAPLVSFLDDEGLAENEPMTLSLAGARSICGPVATRGLRLLTLGVNWQMYRSYFLPLPVLPGGREDGPLRDADVIAQVEQMAGRSLWPNGKPGRRLAKLLTGLKSAGGWSSYIAVRRGAPALGEHRETFDLPPELTDRASWLTDPKEALKGLGGDPDRVAYEFPSWAVARKHLAVEAGLYRVNGVHRVTGALDELTAFRFTGRGIVSAGAIALGDAVTRADDASSLVLVAHNAGVKLGPDAPDAAGGERVFQTGLVALDDRPTGAQYLAASVSSTFAKTRVEGLVAESALGVHADLAIERDSERFDGTKDDDACVVSLCRMPVQVAREVADGGARP